MAETATIERIAKIVSESLFDKLKWKKCGPYDQNFDCLNETQHKPSDKSQKHTHPVDVVYCYKDPYTNKNIYLNTDLKSYKKTSINARSVEKALKSLATTIDCANVSQEWSNRYNLLPGSFEVRGLLFIFNHDNTFEKDFHEFFYPKKPENGGRSANSVNLSKINLSKNRQIHIFDPKIIDYLFTIISDMSDLMSQRKFPIENYGFYYPQLTYSKVVVSDNYLPATIEAITSPFIIIKHDAVIEYDSHGNENKKYNDGYVIYYNRPGETDMEFIYLLDTLSKYQILNQNIRIRIAHKNPHKSVRSHFTRAYEKYAHEWGFDDAMKEKLNSIELTSISTCKRFYINEDIGWDE